MREIRIRHAEPGDYAAIQQIYAGPKAYAGTLQLPFPALELWQKRLNEKPEGFYHLVAEIDGEIVGQLGLQANPNPRRRHCGYLGMGVKDSYQGQGIGSRLITSAIDLAENWLNLCRIELTVFVDNAAAVRLYQKHGFVIEGESAKFAFRNGEYISVYHMARVKA